MECSLAINLLVIGAVAALFLGNPWKWPSQGQVLRGDQLKRRYPRLRWVPWAYTGILTASFALMVGVLAGTVDRPLLHPGIILAGGLALMMVAEGLLGVFSGVYPMDTRWSRLYILGREAAAWGMRRVILGLVLLVASIAVEQRGEGCKGQSLP